MAAELLVVDVEGGHPKICVRKLPPERRENCSLARTVDALVRQKGMTKIIISRRKPL